MNSIINAFLLFVGMTINLYAKEPADKILGNWSNKDHTTQNEINKKANIYEAKLIKGKVYVGSK